MLRYLTTAGRRPSLRILFIEDSADDTALALIALSEGGARPIVEWFRATTQPEVEQALRREWDVILLDWRIPGWSGAQVLDLIRQREADGAPKTAPVIVLSGSMMSYGDLATAMDLGAKAFVEKHDREQLGRVIDEVLMQAGGSLLERTAAYLLALPELAVTILDGLPLAIFAVSSTGTIRLVNREAESISGYGRAELIGATVEMLVTDERRAHHKILRSRYQHAPVERRFPAAGPLQLRRKDGSAILVDIMLKPIMAHEGMMTIAMVRPSLLALRAQLLAQATRGEVAS